MGGYAQVAHKFYVILCKGLERPQIWVSVGGPGTSAPLIPRERLQLAAVLPGV